MFVSGLSPEGQMSDNWESCSSPLWMHYRIICQTTAEEAHNMFFSIWLMSTSSNCTWTCVRTARCVTCCMKVLDAVHLLYVRSWWAGVNIAWLTANDRCCLASSVISVLGLGWTDALWSDKTRIAGVFSHDITADETWLVLTSVCCFGKYQDWL